MHSILRNNIKFVVLLLVVAALLSPGLNRGFVQAAADGAPAANPAAALPVSACTGVGSGTVTCDLFAEVGSISLPDGASVSIWGFSAVSGGPAELPGPLLTAVVGDTVTVNVTNNLSEQLSVLFQGQSLAPDLTGMVANGGTKTYVFTADKPGTYLYEAGLLPNSQFQTAMGLHGPLVVTSTATVPTGFTGVAYNDDSTAFNDEFLVVLSEIDPDLNNSATPASFDMRSFAPKYHLINGRAYPDTVNLESNSGSTVLLRYINASVSQHSMALLGLDQNVIAYDGSPLTNAHRMVAETFGPGQTVDVLVNLPSSAVGGSIYPLYDGNLFLKNSSSAGFGGMLTFLVAGVAGGPPPDTFGPEIPVIGLLPNPSDGMTDVVLSVTVSDVNTGGANIQAAEYFIDTPSAPGTGTPLVPVDVLDTTTENFTATISSATLGTLAPGSHLVYVRGQDALNNWDELNFVSLNLDLEGPASTGLLLNPNPSNGSMDVALKATGDDRFTGNSNIIAGEYTLNGGSAVAMAVNMAAPIASLNAVIPAATVNALNEGPYQVTVRSRDAFNRWGPESTTTLKVDKTAPVPTTNLSANPAVTNGKQGFNSNTPAIRVIATFEDPDKVFGVDPDLVHVQSNIALIEGFIDTIGDNGTGFLLIPSDGKFNSAVETGYIDIPLSTIAMLSDGDHIIYLHARDSSGNWSDANDGQVTLTIDRSVPVADVAPMANPTPNAPHITLTANAADSSTNIVAAEWFDNSDPGQGNGAAMTISTPNSLSSSLTATINIRTWGLGKHTLYVRVRDAAGNWSSPASTEINLTGAYFLPMLQR
jgi:FtsP/CotA-like multicopper oxidase with cupredoxin domain